MLWVKGLHIIAVICWFAAIFYLPRLFVYHCQAIRENDSIGSERFKIMERKLYRGIMTPSMVATVLFGGWLLVDRWDSYFHTATWMHIKLTLVLLLIVFHFVCGHYLKAFAEDKNTKSEKFYRVLNEAPVFLLLGIVFLVTLKQPL